MQNLPHRFDRYYKGQIYGGVFAKICGLLRIYELYQPSFLYTRYGKSQINSDLPTHFDCFLLPYSIIIVPVPLFTYIDRKLGRTSKGEG